MFNDTPKKLFLVMNLIKTRKKADKKHAHHEGGKWFYCKDIIV